MEHYFELTGGINYDGVLPGDPDAAGYRNILVIICVYCCGIICNCGEGSALLTFILEKEENGIAIYFNISMPVMDFLTESHAAMLSHGVNLYAEIFVNDQGERLYSSFESEKVDLFASYFNNTAYNSFFFSCYPIHDVTQIKEFGYFYDTPSSYSIEVNGGRETDKSRELIQMRMISKNPNKQIQSFYRSLQRDLKKISGLQKHTQKNYFYLPSEKIIIPANPHSRNTRDHWEEFNLSKIERVE